MQTTFLIKLELWIESLEAKRYKNHMSRKWRKDKMVMILRSLKMYEYIGSKTKSYQIQKRFLLLFIFLSYQVVPFGRVLLGFPNATFSSYFQAFPEVLLDGLRHQVLP